MATLRLLALCSLPFLATSFNNARRLRLAPAKIGGVLRGERHTPPLHRHFRPRVVLRSSETDQEEMEMKAEQEEYERIRARVRERAEELGASVAPPWCVSKDGRNVPRKTV